MFHVKVLVRVTGKLPWIPKNVLAVDWLPQIDVLGELMYCIMVFTVCNIINV